MSEHPGHREGLRQRLLELETKWLGMEQQALEPPANREFAELAHNTWVALRDAAAALPSGYCSTESHGNNPVLLDDDGICPVCNPAVGGSAPPPSDPPQTCRDHGPHLGFHWCPECYQRAYAAGWDASRTTLEGALKAKAEEWRALAVDEITGAAEPERKGLLVTAGQCHARGWLYRDCADKLDALGSALLAAERRGAQQWQRIETAPKDETRVLLFNPDEFIGSWAVQSGAWYFQLGGWQYDGQTPAYSNAHPPTHWMPLPVPPSSADQPPAKEP